MAAFFTFSSSGGGNAKANVVVNSVAEKERPGDKPIWLRSEVRLNCRSTPSMYISPFVVSLQPANEVGYRAFPTRGAMMASDSPGQC